MHICKECNQSFATERGLVTHIGRYCIGKKQYYDKYLKLNNNEGLCNECNSPTTFISLSKGYSKYCCPKCAGKSIETKDKYNANFQKKYGVNRPMQNDFIKQNYQTNYKIKTGYNTPLENPDVIKKQLQNRMDKHGVQCILQLDEYKLKSKQTKKERYNNEYYNNHEKYKETCLTKYNVDNILKLPSNRIKSRKKIVNRVFIKLFNGKFKDRIIPLFNIDDYDTVQTQYKFQCVKCNSIFYDDINDGKIPRCLNCYPVKQSSLCEHEIIDFIKTINKDIVILNKQKNLIYPFEIDIYLPEYKLAIEYNGNYWHSELNGKDKNYHLNKTKLCQLNSIRLIHIFEDEWMNKSDIVKNKLSSILNNLGNKILTRKCVVKEIDSKIKNEFLNNNHIQGEDKSSVSLGAFYNNELVSVMTFCKERLALGNKKNNDDIFELSRYVINVNSSSIFNKLLSYFIKNYNPKKIITYADRRWSTFNNIYSRNGFNLVGTTHPNYWYMKNYLIREHRFNYRKNILPSKLQVFDNELTEWENMQLNGYDRIWDCGNLKYELIIK